MNDTAVGPASPTSAGLSAEFVPIFEGLGFTAGDWAGLGALPLVQAIWDEGGLTPRAAGRLCRRLRAVYEPKVEPSLDSQETVAKRRCDALEGLVRKHPVTEEDRRTCAEGVSLWCWHLSAEPRWHEHGQALGQLAADAGRVLTAQAKKRLPALLAHCQALIDAHLAQPSFCPDPPGPTGALLAEPAVLTDLATPVRPNALVILPFVALLRAQQNAGAELLPVVETAIKRHQHVKDSLMAQLLAPDWQELLRRFTDGQDAEAPAAYERRWVEWLAGVQFGERERLLRDLEGLAQRIKRPRRLFAGPLFKPDSVSAYFSDLRRRIAEQRRAARTVPAPPGAQTALAPGPLPSVQKLPAEPAVLEVPAFEEPLVLVPDPFVTIGWDAALQEATAMTVPEVRDLLARSQELLFEEWRRAGPGVAVVRRRSAVPASLWFVGDLHADLLALSNAWHYVCRVSEQEGQIPHLVCLGDFVDRGSHDHETLLYLFRLLRDYPEQVGVLPGNHDEDFCWNADAGRFEVGLQPAEYTEHLNTLLGKEDADSQARVELAKLAADFFHQRPRALVLPDGLLVAHGGFPHTDLLPNLTGAADLSRPQCQQDFVWLRIGENARRKRPNRSNRGCEFGHEDFAAFCDWTATHLGIRVRRLLRGHDHVPERFQTYPRYRDCPVLTINSMCRRLADEWLGTSTTWPCIARYVPGRLPEIHRLPLDPAVVEGVYFPPGQV